jgi:hypothetical protein
VGLLLLAVAMGLAAGPVPPALDLAPAIALSYRAEHLKAAFRSGNPETVQGAVQEVELLRRTYGTLDVLPLVEAMAVYARALGDQVRSCWAARSSSCASRACTATCGASPTWRR